jgi:hypothetical protein
MLSAAEKLRALIIVSGYFNDEKNFKVCPCIPYIFNSKF